MNKKTIDKLIEKDIRFSFKKDLATYTKNGLIDFKSIKYNSSNTSWNGEILTIPAYGIYKVSWGFKQSSLDSFYNDDVTKLSLIIDNYKHESEAVINKETRSYYAMKSSCVSIITILKENQNLSLFAEIQKKDNPKMKDIYFSLIKLNTEQSNRLD
jgi:adenylate cyclase class IV